MYTSLEGHERYLNSAAIKSTRLAEGAGIVLNED